MNTASLQFKIVSTLFLVTVSAILLVSAMAWYSYNDRHTETVNLIINDLQGDLERSLENKINIGLTNAVGFASNTILQQSLENGNRDLALRTLQGIGQTYKDNTSFRGIKIHLHTADGRSFLRAWRPKDFNDDLTVFRPGMVEVMKTQKPIATYTTGKRQLMMTGISPVVNQAGDYIGSVEFIQGVGSVSRAYQKRGMHYMMLMNKQALTKSKQAQKNHAVGPYRVANNKWFSEETVAFGNRVDWTAFEQQNWQIVDNHIVTTLPVVNFNNDEIGLHMISVPTTRLEEATGEVFDQVVKEIIEVVVIILLVVVLIIYRLRTLVLLPVQEVQKTVEQVRYQGDYSARVALSSSQDEIGVMAEDINGLLAATQSAIQETSATVQSIQKGNFNHRIKSDLHGDLDVLKKSVNDSAQTISETMSVIGGTLAALKEGNFSQPVARPTNLSGDFEVAIDNASETQAALSQAIAAINVTAQSISRADFSNQISLDLSGELDDVKNNLNHAQVDLNQGFESFTSSLRSLIDGDLTTRVTGSYAGQLSELQEIINASVINISDIFSEVKTKAETSIANVHQVADGNQDINERTRTQAAALEQTATSMGRITENVQNSLSNSQSVYELTQQANSDAKQGAVVMSEAQEAMQGIHEASSKISEITTLIDGIAFQTNLLALNAAVEAARAGEHGRGFAVVAGEVRSLAQKSADAAKDIKKLVVDTTDQIDLGSKLTDQSGEMLQQIIQGIGDVNAMVAEITEATQEQTQGITQVNQSIASLDSNTQQNTEVVMQVTTTTESMSKQMNELVALTQKFKLGGSSN